MSDQEIQFAEMAEELSNYKGGVVTIDMFLKYCPDSVTYLLDRCLSKECMEQVFIFLFKYVQSIKN